MQPLFSTASNKDISYLKKMWKDIFKDEDSYIDLYFSYKFKEGNTFVIKEDEKIVSTLYVEYTDIFNNGKILKGAYFCGIATLKPYRNKGYARLLIEYAKKHINKVDIIYLIPASKSLFDFYKACGFKEFTCLSKETVKCDKAVTLLKYSEEYDYCKMNYFYENMGNSLYVKRDKDFFYAIYNCYKNIMLFDDGYVIYYTNNDILHLVEYSVCEKRAKEILKGILNLKGLEEGILYKRYGDTPFSVCISEIDLSHDKLYVNLMLN